MKYYLAAVGVIIFGYFLGNVNFSILFSKLANRDIRNYGSGNPGAMNMMRSFGAKMGALTLFADAIKGAVPALLGWWLLGSGELLTFGADKTGAFIGGIAVVLGHIFPVFYGFKGGKGVASSVGVCFVIDPVLAAIALVLAFIFLLTVKIGALASFICISIPLIYSSVTAFASGSTVQGILPLVMLAIVILAHRANIFRILRGEEKQVVLFGKKATHKTITEKNIAASDDKHEN